MIYLSGVATAIGDELADGRIGFLKTPVSGNSLDGVAIWAADNGAFNEATFVGEEAWYAWLGRMAKYVSTCLFAVAPDVVGDAKATLARSTPWLAKIRALGYPAAFVAQNGIADTVIPWDDFDWLFIGGDTAFKLGLEAAALIVDAKARGKRVHVGRVNSRKRFDRFAELGVDSVDGTFVAFAPTENAARLRKWLDRPSAQMPMGLT